MIEVEKVEIKVIGPTQGQTYELTGDEWEALTSAADVGLTDLDPPYMRVALRALDKVGL
jgi:hypothetical protein